MDSENRKKNSQQCLKVLESVQNEIKFIRENHQPLIISLTNEIQNLKNQVSRLENVRFLLQCERFLKEHEDFSVID